MANYPPLKRKALLLVFPKATNLEITLKTGDQNIYKTGSYCIANRIKRVLPSLTDDDQTGFISNRYMGDNVRSIYDLINYLNKKERSLDCCYASTLRKRLTLLTGGSCLRLFEHLFLEKTFVNG